MIAVAGQMFIEYEKELENSNQIIKGYEDYIGDNKIKKVILDKVCPDNVKGYCFQRDEVYKSTSIERFVIFIKNKKRELQRNK